MFIKVRENNTLFITMLLFVLFAASHINAKTIAPDFSSRDISNKTNITLSEYRGKPVLVNFWATWCPPCRMEIPDFIMLYKKYSGKFEIIGISVDRDFSAIQPFYRNNKINYGVVYFTEKIIADYGGISAIPTSFLINKKGEISKKIVGYRDAAFWENEITKLIGEK